MLKISNKQLVEKVAQWEEGEELAEQEFRKGIKGIMERRKGVPNLAKIDSMEDTDIL